MSRIDRIIILTKLSEEKVSIKEVIRAQNLARVATEKARDIYEKFINQVK